MLLNSIVLSIILVGILVQCTGGSVMTTKVTNRNDATRIFIQDNTVKLINIDQSDLTMYDTNPLYHVLANLTNNGLVNITTNMTLFSTIELENFENISIIGHNKPTVECANVGGLLLFLSCYNCTIEGIIWRNCGYISSIGQPVLGLYKPAKLTIQDCLFEQSVGQTVVLSEVSGDVNVVNCKFKSNRIGVYDGHGVAIHYSSTKEFQFTFTISNCDFAHYHKAKSIVYIAQSTNYPNRNFTLHNSTFIHNQGTPIYVLSEALLVTGTVIFDQNMAINGGGIFLSDRSHIIFDENSNVIFDNNTAAANGGAIYQQKQSIITFKNNSIVQFIGNQAVSNGGAIYSHNESKIIFEGNSQVSFDKNKALNGNGGALFTNAKINITFKGSSEASFTNNVALGKGGAITSKLNSSVTFERKSEVTFISNRGQENGGAISSSGNSQLTFKDNSIIRFVQNMAMQGAAIFTSRNSSITFKENSVVIFTRNLAILSNNGPQHNVDGTLNGNDAVTESTVNSGAVHLKHHCNITFEGKSLATFSLNKGTYGGGIHTYDTSYLTVKDYATVTFDYNEAVFGGAVYANKNSDMSFAGKSSLFVGNTATLDGGSLYSYGSSNITFKENMTVLFVYGKATRNGGVGYFNADCHVVFEENSTVMFDNNKAAGDAGALYASGSDVAFRGNSSITFDNNRATLSGGALYFTNSSVTSFSEISKVTFYNNKALHGGAMCSNYNNNIKFKDNSKILFKENIAIVNGGAINALSDSNIILMDATTTTFTNNTAQYGGAIFFDTAHGAFIVNNTEKGKVNFIKNNARIAGNSVYLDVIKSCNSSCLTNRVVGIDTNSFITTPPSKLELYDPAICIDDNTNTDCDTYYLQNIMFGQDIIIPACVLDYYDQKPVDTTQFLVHGESNHGYFITGSNEILIACDTFQGISVIGNESLSTSMNYSITIDINVDHNSDWKPISVNLIVELSPCHPGFQYDKELQTCECHNVNNIVFCSGSTSSIKRGYWFGSVSGKPTVTFCPTNYCNFTCCNTGNGFYHLSPLRDNQCKSHRSGVACGSCTEGYTLSFDSTDCIQVTKCTTVSSLLIIIITLIYWIAVVTVVFVMMHYKVSIGYLYSITFYYSIIDILLRQNLYLSQALFMTVNIISSTAKLTPQFLGQLCLAKNMSGIDQQFIHYIHPLAVSFILLIISLLARCSYRLSAFISREIIPVICFLLLLSYTSVATTSLLLMRALTFLDVDKIYTYLSPDIEYFHGRHLVYAITAILFIIFIVIGLPLLLSLEPFLNGKINFTRIKPLLDQFQGCYKDKYRHFAAYYMICRLAIILIIITNSSNDFIDQYLLIAACVTIALLHLSVRPYADNMLNTLDGIILQLLILVAVLPLFDASESTLVMVISFILVLSPMLLLFVIELVIHKDYIKKIITCFKFNILEDKKKTTKMTTSIGRLGNKGTENRAKIGQNATGPTKNLEMIWYRDSFLEAMGNIQD